MNTREHGLLTEIATDIKWMKGKQAEHDKVLDTIQCDIKKFPEELDRTKNSLTAVKTRLNGLITVLMIVLPILCGVGTWIINRIIQSR